MGFSEGGVDLLYGLEIARASEALPANYVQFPNLPISLTWRDRQPVASHQNLAGDEKRTFVKILAPDVSIALDALSESDLAFWRALHLNPTDFYIVRIKRTERILAQDAIVQEDPPGTFFCAVPHSSYTLASKRSVAALGPSLLSGFKIGADWRTAMRDDAVPGPSNFFTSYSDATEIATLNAAFAPTAGSRCYVSFSATGWLVTPEPGFAWNPITARSDLHMGTLVLKAA